MTVWILVMHLFMTDGSVKTFQKEYIGTLEACLDYGKDEINIIHTQNPDSTSGLHFCIKKDKG
jgi:hypothetical protein